MSSIGQSPILNAAHVLSDGEIAAFRRPPTKTIFKPGTVLHRIVTRGENSAEGSWWIQAETLRRMQLMALQNGVPFAQVARPLLAVRHDWSTKMDFLLTARLACEAIGWVGATRHQQIDDQRQNANIVFIGGFEQVLLPNLLGDTHHTPAAVKAAHQGLPSPRASITSHEHLS